MMQKRTELKPSWIDYIVLAEQMIKRGEVKEDTNLEALANKLKKKDRDESRSSFIGEG